MKIPNEKCLSGTTNRKVPYFLVADEAFGLNRHLLHPYGGHNLKIEKIIFNYRLSRVRRYIKCAFGVFSDKLRIFHRSINLDTNFAIDIVKACVVLHNFVCDRDRYVAEDLMTITGLENIFTLCQVQGGMLANNVRKIMINYFLTPFGSVQCRCRKFNLVQHTYLM